MTKEQNYIRTITDEINRDLSTMPEEYQKGFRRAMQHSLNLFQIWFPEEEATEIENRWAKNTFKS
jgi:hypothetical protein